MTTPPANTRDSGFTLLELVISMLLLTLIVGMVFGIARTSLALGNSIVTTQNEEMELQAFFDLLGLRFSALPGNARFDLKVEDTGVHYLSDLTLQNVPLSFTWGGEETIAKAVQLSTVKRRSGYLDIVLRYFENEILEDSESTMGPSALENEPFAEIVLLEDVSYFEWRVLDGNSMEWLFDWDMPGRLPLQIELTLAVGAKGEEIRQIFWLPPKQNPDAVIPQMLMQHLMLNRGQGGDAGTGAGGDSANPGSPNINIPSGVPVPPSTE